MMAVAMALRVLIVCSMIRSEWRICVLRRQRKCEEKQGKNEFNACFLEISEGPATNTVQVTVDNRRMNALLKS
jgi:hypothetical protein